MAVPKENLLSLGHLTRTRRDTLSKQRERSGRNSANKPWRLSTKGLASDGHQHLTVMHLQQRLQELKERERMAQQRNRQLLQQFEEAQDMLKEMMASNAAMKTIRMEYERYLQENGPHWQRQFQEKEQRAHEKRNKNHLSSDLKSTELTADGSHTLQETATIQECSNFSQDQWLSRAQSRPVQSSSHVPSSLVPPTNFPHRQPLTHHNFRSATDHHKPWLTQDPPGWASLQADHSWSWAGGLAVLAAASESLLRHLDQKEPPPELNGEAEAKKASDSGSDGIGGNRRNLSPQELDMKPVRMSSSHAESTESGRDSSLASTEKMKRRRGKSQHSSSPRRSSQEVLTASWAPATSQVTVDQSSEGDISSENGHTSESSARMKRSEGFAAGPQKPEKAEKEQTSETRNSLESHSEESEHTGEAEGGASEKEGSRSPEDKSQSCMEEEDEESQSESLKIKSSPADKIEKEESSSEGSSFEEKQEKLRKKNEEAKEEDGNQEKKDEDEIKLDRHGEDEASARNNTTEEGTEAEDEDEIDTPEDDEDSDRKQNKDPEDRKPESASSQDEAEDEDGSEGSEEEEEEEEQGQSGEDGGVPTEDRDSDDSIISPQEKRPKTMQMIQEEAAEDDEGEEEEESEEGSSDSDSNGSSDVEIENLLAPQEPTNKEEKQHKTQEEPPGLRDKVMIFQVQQNSPKSDHQSDSDEFDHFYD